MRNWSLRELHGEVHKVDQDKDMHPQAQSLPEVQEQELLVLHDFKNSYSPCECEECIGYLFTH